jgi:hypothetical protein
VPSAARDHTRHDCFDAVHDAEVVQRHRGHVVVVHDTAGIENGEVDAAPGVLDGARRGGDGGAIGDVGRHHQDARSIGAGRDLLEKIAPARGHGDPGATREERFHQCGADTGARAGDPDSFISPIVLRQLLFHWPRGPPPPLASISRELRRTRRSLGGGGHPRAFLPTARFR